MGSIRHRSLGKTYIKEWRLKRGLSLRRLEDRLETLPDGKPMITHVSINRIEMSKQPYSQEVLEALAAALECTPAELISVDPNSENEMLELLRRLPADKYRQAINFIKFLGEAN
ncbi:helix-turn-helix domain-containing protein [Labrys portucalensis]|uniref:Helix-turn-helix domain-containing protein n=1 Tax=Labrys neptuniae TaxID=376174 RepID=A0ABV6ZMV5_9HYPH